MKFKCHLNSETWYGDITNVIRYQNHTELFIVSRSSIMLIYGETSRGKFVCAPDFRVSSHLVELDNLFWNTENLVEVLGKVDGITAATALYEFSKFEKKRKEKKRDKCVILTYYSNELITFLKKMRQLSCHPLSVKLD